LGNNKKQIGWAIMYLVLMVMMLTPLNFIALSLLIVPLLALFMTTEGKKLVLYYVVLAIVPFVWLGATGLFTLMVTLFFLVPALMMGRLYKQKKPAIAVLTAGILTMLIEFLFIYGISASFGLNMTHVLVTAVEETINTLPSTYKEILPEGYSQNIAAVVVKLIPLYMIVSSFYFVSLSHTLTRRWMGKQGIVLPKLNPIREWMLPKSLVFYYLISLVIDMFVAPDPESTLAMILMNLIPLLNIAFCIQAFSFICFVAHKKKWNKFIVFIGLVLVIFFPPLSLLGVFDTAFPIRQRFKN
jgi:uncharacterized protein YybS (DUF2232 family)